MKIWLTLLTAREYAYVNITHQLPFKIKTTKIKSKLFKTIINTRVKPFAFP